MPPGQREHERDARDRAVLHALRPGRAHDGDAARLEVEHRHPLRVAHQRLGAGAGGEPHLDAARGVGGAEERLRPGRVVAVDEDLLGAVDRQRLGVGDEAVDRELEVAPLLDRALGHHAGPARLRADEERDRVQRRVAGDADGRLDLGEAARRRLGRVGREQRRALLQVRHVRLVRRRAAGPQLLEREHQLDRVEQAGDARELRRRQATREPDDLGARDVDVDEHPGELEVRGAPSPRRRSRGRARARRGSGRSRRTRPRRARPSATTTPSSTTSSGSGSFGPFAATSPSSGSGVTSSSRRSSFAAREAKRADRSATDEPLARHTRPPPRGRTPPSAAPPSRRAAAPTPRARPPSSARAAARCRSRAAGRRARRRARPPGRGCRRAAGVPSRGRPPPGGASVAGVARTSAATSVPVARRLERDLVEREPGRRLDEIGPPRAERIVDGRVEGHRVRDFIGLRP